MARRGDHSLAEIKEMVLNTAETIVREEGFSKLTTRKIAMEMGYTVGTIYMVFTNMTDLILHIKGRTLTNLLAHLEQVNDGNIETCAKTYLDYARLNFNLWSMVFEHRLPAQTMLPEWYLEKIEAIYEKIETLITQIAPNQDEKRIKQAARVLINGIQGICTWQLSSNINSKEDNEEAVALLVRNFMRGWMTSCKNQ